MYFSRNEINIYILVEKKMCQSPKKTYQLLSQMTNSFCHLAWAQHSVQCSAVHSLPSLTRCVCPAVLLTFTQPSVEEHAWLFGVVRLWSSVAGRHLSESQHSLATRRDREGHRRHSVFYQPSVKRHDVELAAAVDEAARDARLDEARLDSDNVLSGAFVSAAENRNRRWTELTKSTFSWTFLFIQQKQDNQDLTDVDLTDIRVEWSIVFMMMLW